MASKKDSDELFELAGSDPSSWLHQARLLKTSAQLSLDEITKVTQSDLSPAERSEALMTYMQSFMLLTSFCFENLIKGILISRTPYMVDRQKLNTALWGGKNGHKIAELIPADIALSAEEQELLTRLQTFAIWAGRYPIPLWSNDYHASEGLLRFNSTDPALIEQLFFRLSRQVLEVG